MPEIHFITGVLSESSIEGDDSLQLIGVFTGGFEGECQTVSVHISDNHLSVNEHPEVPVVRRGGQLGVWITYFEVAEPIPLENLFDHLFEVTATCVGENTASDQLNARFQFSQQGQNDNAFLANPNSTFISPIIRVDGDCTDTDSRDVFFLSLPIVPNDQADTAVWSSTGLGEGVELDWDREEEFLAFDPQQGTSSSASPLMMMSITLPVPFVSADAIIQSGSTSSEFRSELAFKSLNPCSCPNAQLFLRPVNDCNDDGTRDVEATVEFRNPVMEPPTDDIIFNWKIGDTSHPNEVVNRQELEQGSPVRRTEVFSLQTRPGEALEYVVQVILWAPDGCRNALMEQGEVLVEAAVSVEPCHPACPEITITLQPDDIGECRNDGTRELRTITPAIEIGPSIAPFTYEIFADGTSQGSFTVNPSPNPITSNPSIESVPGDLELSVVVSFSDDVPIECAPETITLTIPPCPQRPPECPDITLRFSGHDEGSCTEGRREITLEAEADVDPDLVQRFVLYVDDESVAEFENAASVTHSTELAPGEHTYRAAIRGDFSSDVCESPTLTITVSECEIPCPSISIVSVGHDDETPCDGFTRMVTVTAAAAIAPAEVDRLVLSVNGEIQREVSSSSSTAAQVQLLPGDHTIIAELHLIGRDDPCPPTVQTISVRKCPEIPEECGICKQLCGGFGLIIVVLTALASIITALFFVALCSPFNPNLPVSSLSDAAIAAWIAVGVAIGAAYLLCAIFESCECPTACDFIKLGWITALASSLTFLVYYDCCMGNEGLILGVVLFAIFLFVGDLWRRRCDPPFCDIMVQLGFVLGAIIAGLGYADSWSTVLDNCRSDVVKNIIYATSVLVGVFVVDCQLSGSEEDG